MYIHGIVIDPSSRFSGGLINFFNKMCYFIFCNTSGEKQIFPL
ncbi:hypothetical protein SeKA_A3219 [Salmonella enterica subsp. enterica serovar Kentucky str. CVM29188]|uniref:Uncharacterized protein n=1 Tax=Salmonella enterica subsp. enterica serovar Cubana str. 76814 TaxID=1192560 RepID=V7IWN5_SALET|nr:hypothetical protein SeKA_A3219 [Salmonella enterica subsp. enterica serovar Kentucky str. CVM29188]ETA89706.1 hypothetical protein A628_00347 [Salmonella enterica subsp. enterica serovar Cubana str. 76814]